jgi:hypothetical protein
MNLKTKCLCSKKNLLIGKFSFKRLVKTKAPFQFSKPLKPTGFYKSLIFKELKLIDYLKSYFIKIGTIDCVDFERSITLNRQFFY